MDHTSSRPAAAAALERAIDLLEFIMSTGKMRRQEVGNVIRLVNCFISQAI